MYFNTRHERTGVLFQGKFKAIGAQENEYLKYLISYIHLNPIDLIQTNWKDTGVENTTQAFEYLSNYRYSSFPDFNGMQRYESIIINRTPLPEYFSDTLDFHETMQTWLSYGCGE